MARLLAIETSGTTCGACISIEGALTSVSEVYRVNVHEENLERCVMNALAMASMSMDDVDAVAVSAGPGSFTGLRIGLSFVKGLCFDGAASFLGIDTLESLAWASREVAIVSRESTIHCLIPSHRDLFYIGSYEVTSDGIEPKHSNGIVELVPLQEIRNRTTTGMLCGPGAHSVTHARAPSIAHAEAPSVAHAGAPSPISGLTRLSSRFVALAASKRLIAQPGKFDDAASFEPMYRQDWVAATKDESSGLARGC